MAEAGSLESESMSEVLIKGLKKVYDNKVTAVHDVNLKIADKEYIDGKLCNDVAPKDRDIAMVFQNYALYPHMSVYDNMAFALKLKKVPKAEIDKKVREVAEILDITQYLERKPKALSGGQRQRIGTNFMYVTHDQTEAITLADRIVIMKDGYVNQIGTPQDLFGKPVNLFVAGFIGMPVMNFFDNCKLVFKGGKYYAEICEANYFFQ